ncbi:hypothetical protein VKT23_018861 [Stygiomarasmius scandens]|uniref:Uncharacterized protein n=1 Tax=Marasmiellus scandens TaxID=2682957 RepID=A0ABR1IND7_9AGAR
MPCTMTQSYPRFHPYMRVLYGNVDDSSPEFNDCHVGAADSSRFLEAVAQLPPLAEQPQPPRLEQYHEQQQKQPENHEDTANANIVESVVPRRGWIAWSKKYLFVVLMFMVIVILVLFMQRFCSCSCTARILF